MRGRKREREIDMTMEGEGEEKLIHISAPFVPVQTIHTNTSPPLCFKKTDVQLPEALKAIVTQRNLFAIQSPEER